VYSFKICLGINWLIILSAHTVCLREFMACTVSFFNPLDENNSRDLSKIISVTYSECVFVALNVQCATHTRHIVSTAFPALQHLSTLSDKQHDLTKQLLSAEYEVCFSIYFTYIIC
jgi:hypothetical protein